MLEKGTREKKNLVLVVVKVVVKKIWDHFKSLQFLDDVLLTQKR